MFFMENITNNNSGDITSSSLNTYFYTFVYPVIALLSLVLNLFSFVIFSDAEFKNEKLFAYLKLQSLCISTDMLVVFFSTFLEDEQWQISKTWAAKWLYQYVFTYFKDVLEKTELLLAILAAYYCLKMITQLTTARKQSVGNNVSCISIGLLALMCATTSHKIFRYEIQPQTANYALNNQTIYEIVKTGFGLSRFYKDVEILSFALNNGLFLLALIYLNFRIVRKSRSNINVKLKITRGRGQRTEKTVEECAKAAKAKLTKMIVLDCFNTILGHFLIVTYYTLKNTLAGGFPYDGPIWSVIYFSFFFKFFIFFYFNKRFRQNANKKVAKFKLIIAIRRNEPICPSKS
jgi:hypothetical protein